MPEPALPNTLAECHARMREMAKVHADQQALIAEQQTTIKQQQATIAQQQVLIEQQQATIEQQQATIDEQQALLKALQKDVALLKRSLFGHRRERFEDPNQRLLFDFAELVESDSESHQDASDEDEEEENPKPRSRRRGRVRRVIPECLPRVPRYQDLDENAIPADLPGQASRRFHKKVGAYLEWQPPQLYVVEEYVEVLAIDNEDATETAMITAPKEPRILNSLVGPAMLAYFATSRFATSRFADHQPYYRLEEQLQRSGVSIDRSTICRWMIQLSGTLLPLVNRMRQLVLLCEAKVSSLFGGAGWCAGRSTLDSLSTSSRWPSPVTMMPELRMCPSSMRRSRPRRFSGRRYGPAGMPSVFVSFRSSGKVAGSTTFGSPATSGPTRKESGLFRA